MLDIMRKHASSWLIKVILGAIIITFIFFFGYSSYRKGSRGGRVGAEGRVAAEVNGVPVSASEFDFFFSRNLEQVKAQFEGKEIPPFVRQIAESSTMRQIVGREVMLQQADSLGLVVPDEMLADTIRDVQAAQAGGEFDPIAYRHEFLPYFRNRFGMDYEEFVRQDLRIGALQELFKGIEAAPHGSAEGAPASTTWTFEAVAIDPKALVESKAVLSEADAPDFAQKLAAAEPRSWQKILGPAKLEAKKVGPVRISERAKLLGGSGTMADYEAIFSLTEEAPVSKPIEAGGQIHVVKLVERIQSVPKDEPAALSGSFFDQWMGKVLAKAKVHDYMAKEQK